MSNEQNKNQEPNLNQISPDKMQFLQQMLGQINGMNPNSVLPMLSGLSQNPEAQKMNFTDSETNMILELLKQRMTPEERSRIDMIRMISQMIGNKGKR